MAVMAYMFQLLICSVLVESKAVFVDCATPQGSHTSAAHHLSQYLNRMLASEVVHSVLLE